MYDEKILYVRGLCFMYDTYTSYETDLEYTIDFYKLNKTSFDFT